MSQIFLQLVALTFIAAGCNLAVQQASKQPQQTILKPIVTIVPVIDSTKDSHWGLSDEFTYCINHQLAQRNHFFLLDPDKTCRVTYQPSFAQNPFIQDVTWIKKSFFNQEFVVFLELIEHNEVARQGDKKPFDSLKCSAELLMTMRIRIFDLRGEEPKIVLQELLHESHFIPRAFTRSNFQQEKWGHETFAISPMGLAHSQFIRHICNRLEEYILWTAHRD
jgi:hypothetical protein